MDVKNVIFFSIGSVVGGFIGYQFCKKKYNIVFVEDVESSSEDSEEERKEYKKKQKKEYSEQLYEASYAKREVDADEEWDEADKESPVEPQMVPYQISPDAFLNEHQDYAKMTLVYYEMSNTLLNDEEEECDIESNIGNDAINHFGEYEKDAVFIRNEALGNDYEVLLEHASYNGGE